jgi:hypothetical protein
METPTAIQDFCRRYFQAVDASLLVDQENFLQVELPREIDKELTDRPYYWMYIEATGQQVPNTVISLSFAPDLEIAGVEKMEFVTLGSFRLNKIIESAQKRGRFTRAYQASPLHQGHALAPVLLTTFKLSFVADRRRDEMVSYGVHLGTGQVYQDLYDRIESLPFVAEPPTGTRLSPVTVSQERVKGGMQAIQNHLQKEIESLDHTWAVEAENNLKRELEQLETYYESLGLVNQDELKSDEEKTK